MACHVQYHYIDVDRLKLAKGSPLPGLSPYDDIIRSVQHVLQNRIQ